jgi:microcystin-dependent protein
VTLDATKMPSYRHRAASDASWNDMSDGMGLEYGGIGGAGGTSSRPTSWYDTDATGHQLIENTGGGGAHENLPPYYAVVFCIKYRHESRD